MADEQLRAATNHRAPHAPSLAQERRRQGGGAGPRPGRGPSGERSFENDLCFDVGVSLGSKDWDLPFLPGKEEERFPVWQLQTWSGEYGE